MHAAVIASNLGPEGLRLGEFDADDSAVKALTVEIGTLSEERSQMTVLVLHERSIQSRPMKAATRMCVEGLSSSEAQQPLKQSRRDAPGAGFLQRKLYSYVPALTWIPQLRLSTVRADVIAGVTVGVMVIPQSMSYGRIAGLPYVYGMYSACVPTFVYALFGQSRQLAVGPVAMVSLLVEAGLRGVLTKEQCPKWYAAGGEASGRLQYNDCPLEYAQLATLAAATVGMMQIVASILKLGFLVSFLGHPVTSGFTSGAAIIIGCSQLKHILGYEIHNSEYIYETIWELVRDMHKTQAMPLILGLLTLAFLIVNKKLAMKYKRISMMGPMGPLICCLVGTLLVWASPSLREDHNVAGWTPDAFRKILPTARQELGGEARLRD